MMIVLVLFSILFGLSTVSIAFVMGASFWTCLAIYAGSGVALLFSAMIFAIIGDFSARLRSGENEAA